MRDLRREPPHGARSRPPIDRAGIDRAARRCRDAGAPPHEERIGERIATIEQELSAQPLRGKEARALGVADGYAGFVIARRYLSASGTVVLVTSTVFPYDRMRYSIALTMP